MKAQKVLLFLNLLGGNKCGRAVMGSVGGRRRSHPKKSLLVMGLVMRFGFTRTKDRRLLR